MELFHQVVPHRPSDLNVLTQTCRNFFLDYSPFIRYNDKCVDAQKQNGALLIAACIVAAIRLRGEPIRPSPKLMSTIADAVQLARMVLREIER